MNIQSTRKTLIVLIFLIILVLLLFIMFNHTGGPFSDPPISINEGDIVGVWKNTYGFLPSFGINLGYSASDYLIIREDGKYKQCFQDDDYSFTTPWLDWHLEYFPNGNIRLHLEGARNYSVSKKLAERNGLHYECPEQYSDCTLASQPYPYFDPFEEEYVPMINELVLNVRYKREKIVLLHLWQGTTKGFPIIGGESEVFNRVIEW